VFGKGDTFWTYQPSTTTSAVKLKPFEIHNDCGQVSIQKRWSLIQQETNKYFGLIQTVQRRSKSGISVIDKEEAIAKRDEKKRQE
jgi:hypothetical protein